MNLLFYSTQCQFSKLIIILLKKHDLFDDFKMICIEDLKKDQIPSNIKKVPTMLVQDVKKPLSGKDAFLWLDTKTKIGLDSKKCKILGDADSEKIDKKIRSGFEDMKEINISKNNGSFSYVDEDQDEKLAFDKSKGVKEKDFIYTAKLDGEKKIKEKDKTLDSYKARRNKEYKKLKKDITNCDEKEIIKKLYKDIDNISGI